MLNKITKIVWNVLLKLANKYRKEAETCLEVGACYAALVSIRAALEAALLARFLLECFNFSEEELKEIGIKIIDDFTLERIEGFYFKLNELIETIYSLKLITKQGRKAAHRIRVWGNKIHATRVANKNSLPEIGKRSVKARLKDFDLIINQLLRTL